MLIASKTLLGVTCLWLFTSCTISPISEPLAAPSAHKPLPDGLVILDLRAPRWKVTHLVPNVRGAVQHFGDDAVPGGLPNHIASSLLAKLDGRSVRAITFKTIDLRVYVPDLNVPAMGRNTLNADQLHYQLTAKSSVTAVLCVSVDGSDYLGDFGTTARFGLADELRQAIDKSVTKLASGVKAGQITASVACEPGWEGGQPN